jgi:uncharacterized protein YecE (DUF72 family)
VADPGKILIGTQGFSFDDWVGPFYPSGTPKRAYLEAYAAQLPTVEIDATFYAPPRESVVDGWRERTPKDFVFSAKFPRSITHEKKLDRAQGEAQAFIERMRRLGDKLGVLTLQFAYDFSPDYFDSLDAFLEELPDGTRYAVEIRNRKWYELPLADMLSAHNVALVLQDLYYMPKLDWVTADFSVVRWLGRRSDVERFDRIQIDRADDMRSWSETVMGFVRQGIDLYGYFNNHYAGHSPASARAFAELLGFELGPAGDASSGPVQMGLGLDGDDN